MSKNVGPFLKIILFYIPKWNLLAIMWLRCESLVKYCLKRRCVLSVFSISPLIVLNKYIIFSINRQDTDFNHLRFTAGISVEGNGTTPCDCQYVFISFCSVKPILFVFVTSGAPLDKHFMWDIYPFWKRHDSYACATVFVPWWVSVVPFFVHSVIDCIS